MQSKLCSNPQRSVLIFLNRGHQIGVQAVLGRIMNRWLAGFNGYQPIARGGPDAALAIRADGPETVMGASPAEPVILENPILITYDSLPCGDPERSVRLFRHGNAVFVAYFRRVRPVEYVEAHAVESDNSKPGAEPEITVLRLENHFRSVLREALFDFPGVIAILDRFGRARVQPQRRQRPDQTGCAGEDLRQNPAERPFSPPAKKSRRVEHSWDRVFQSMEITKPEVINRL